MREVLLLWLFASLGFGVVIVIVLLALGAVFGVVKLVWAALRCGLVMLDFVLDGKTARGVGRADAPTDDSSVSRRVRQTGAQRVVRVPGRLVSPSTCLAQRDHSRLGGR